MNNDDPLSESEDVLDIGLSDEFWPELVNLKAETTTRNLRPGSNGAQADTGLEQPAANSQSSSLPQSAVKPVSPASVASNSFFSSVLPILRLVKICNYIRYNL